MAEDAAGWKAGRMGVPQDPHRSGWHWVGGIPHQWLSDRQCWKLGEEELLPSAMEALAYEGPCAKPGQDRLDERKGRSQAYLEASGMLDHILEVQSPGLPEEALTTLRHYLNNTRQELAALSHLMGTERGLRLLSNLEADELLVQSLAARVAAKMAVSRMKGRGGWHTQACPADNLSQMLHEHIGKGDPMDVAIIASMLVLRDESIHPHAEEVSARPAHS